MHLTQCINSRSPQKPEAQPGPSNRRGTYKSLQTNDQRRQIIEHSPQDLVSTSTRRNEVISRQHASASQQSGENPKALRAQCNGKNLRAEQTQWTGGNLMAVKIQQMGVNLEIEVAYSHTLTSKEVSARSSSRNVFWRLGRGANLRDTLNRRRDQERS